MPIASSIAEPAAAPAPIDGLRSPGVGLLLLESRALVEYAALLAAWPWLSRWPRGDGHPVFVIPGLAANDLTTAPLRHFLRRRGYAVQAWGQGLNRGPRAGVLERCARDLRDLADRHGRAVSLVGWSLGGVYARALAKQDPEVSRCVVTLGAPFTGDPRATNAWRLYRWLSGSSLAQALALQQRVRVPPPLPTTSIYSRSDGVVGWRCSVDEPSPLAENIAVPSSHSGLGAHPLALYALADRLAQPVGRWQPFAPAGTRRLFLRAG